MSKKEPGPDLPALPDDRNLLDYLAVALNHDADKLARLHFLAMAAEAGISKGADQVKFAHELLQFFNGASPPALTTVKGGKHD